MCGVHAATTIKVGTYNLWNVMFNWNVRKHYIAELVGTSISNGIILTDLILQDQDLK